jgi:hypothetical protein
MRTPAFPAMHYDLADNEHGLTMRDYFAAKAIEGFCVAMSQRIRVHHELIAKDAYAMADAMMEAREK